MWDRCVSHALQGTSGSTGPPMIGLMATSADPFLPSCLCAFVVSLSRRSTHEPARVLGHCDRQVELVAAAGEVTLELAERLVLLVADAGHGQVHRLADLGDGPPSGPELDDPVLPRGEDGP